MLYDNTLDVQFRKTCLLVCRLIFRFRDGVVTARPSVRSDPPLKRGAAKQERALAQALVHEELDDGGRGCWLSGRGAGAHSSVLLVADAAKLANEPHGVLLTRLARLGVPVADCDATALAAEVAQGAAWLQAGA